jgi:hypothetical protein
MEISEEAREKREAYAAYRACDAAGLTEVERLTRERDDLLAVKARMEALHVTCLCGICHECGAEWPCRTHVAIRGES